MCELNIGKAMKALRKKKAMTQGDIFRATGLERSHISKIESGEIAYPKIRTIYKIAKSFNLSVSRFLKYAEDNSKKKK